MVHIYNMDFESPDVMKDFPGLYASDQHRTGSNDIEYGDSGEITKRDILIGKKKDKKDKKDKERGYAALEGESSAEEIYEVRSPSKSKKTKSFKFPTKSKEKREKSREKEVTDKKKEKDKKPEKKVEKEKSKVDKKDKKTKYEEWSDIADVLPIFGVNLKLAIERGRCHDGIDIPVPVRACIDYIEKYGLRFEGVYKVNAPKSKVSQLKKLYNQRENVDLSEFDIPTATSLLKLFLRDMPEPVFTIEFAVRFEEAGAILNVAMREKHLKLLVGNLPSYNKLLLSWLMVHFYNVTLNEKYNKMNVQNLVLCLSSTLQTSNRLLTALLCHCPALFPNTILEPYVCPLTSSAQLPDDPDLMGQELLKQESLLAQIHAEMNIGFISKQREELLWEVQRIITQLKRKLKIANKDKDTVVEKFMENKKSVDIVQTTAEDVRACIAVEQEVDDVNECPIESTEDKAIEKINSTFSNSANKLSKSDTSSTASFDKTCVKDTEKLEEQQETCLETESLFTDKNIARLQSKNTLLNELRESLCKQIEKEKTKILALKEQLSAKCFNLAPICTDTNCASLDEIMFLLHKENQILQIKKINLVRQIMEQQEACIELQSYLHTSTECKPAI